MYIALLGVVYLLTAPSAGGDPCDAEALNDRGRAEFERKHYKRAAALFAKAAEQHGSHAGSADLRVVDFMLNQATAWHMAKRDADAARVLRQALAVDESKPSPGGLRIARDLANLGVVLASMGQIDAAQASFLRAISIRDAATPAAIDENAAMCMESLAESYRRQRRFDDAEAWLRRAAKAWETTLGSRSAELSRHLELYVSMLRGMEKYATAAELEVKAVRIEVGTALRN